MITLMQHLLQCQQKFLIRHPECAADPAWNGATGFVRYAEAYLERNPATASFAAGAGLGLRLADGTGVTLQKQSGGDADMISTDSVAITPELGIGAGGPDMHGRPGVAL